MARVFTRRIVVAGTAAVAMQPWSAAQAKYPFCHALELANFALPETTFWVDTFQSEVRKRIEWADGLNAKPGLSVSPIQEAVARLAAGALEMSVIHSSWVSSRVPDFAVLSDPRLGPAVARSDDRLQVLVQRMTELAEKADLTLLGLSWIFDFLGLRQKRAVNTLADLKGLTIGARGVQTQAFVSTLGGKPAELPTNAMSVALQNGAIDGAILSARELERAKLEDLSLVSFSTRLQLLQGYVMLMNRPLLSRVDKSAQDAFSNGGRAAANLYQRSEDDLRKRILAGDFRSFSKIYTIAATEIPIVERELIPVLDKQYAERKVSAETLALVRSLGAA